VTWLAYRTWEKVSNSFSENHYCKVPPSGRDELQVICLREGAAGEEKRRVSESGRILSRYRLFTALGEIRQHAIGVLQEGWNLAPAV